MSETIVVAGALAQRPWIGGHTWVFLQYLLGFRRLGFDVLFVDRLEPGMCIRRLGSTCLVPLVGEPPLPRPRDGALRPGRALVLAVRRRAGDSGSATPGSGRSCRPLGPSPERDGLSATTRSCWPPPPLRVFLDIDPGFGQMWRALGLADVFDGHDAHVTIGGGRRRAGLPDPDLRARLDHDAPAGGAGAGGPPPTAAATRFTSVASWRGAFGPIEYDGRTLRPARARVRAASPTCRRGPSARFEVALDIDDADAADRERAARARLGARRPSRGGWRPVALSRATSRARRRS